MAKKTAVRRRPAPVASDEEEVEVFNLDLPDSSDEDDEKNDNEQVGLFVIIVRCKYLSVETKYSFCRALVMLNLMMMMMMIMMMMMTTTIDPVIMKMTMMKIMSLVT